MLYYEHLVRYNVIKNKRFKGGKKMTVNETYEILKSDKARALMEKLYGAAAKENKDVYKRQA